MSLSKFLDIAGFVVIVSLIIFLQTNRNADLKVKILNTVSAFWLLLIGLNVYADSGRWGSSLFIMIIFGLLMIPLAKNRKRWLAFCRRCGRTVHFFQSLSSVCPNCKSKDLI